MGVKVGDTLYGFCNGYFGRDSYGDKRVVGIGQDGGIRWIVAREGKWLVFAEGFSKDQLKEWTVEEEMESYQ